MLLMLAALLPAIDLQDPEWPQWRGPTRDGVWSEPAARASLPDTLTPKWRTKIGSGYCGPEQPSCSASHDGHTTAARAQIIVFL